MPNKLCGEIAYSFPNFEDVIIYPCWDCKSIHASKGAPGYKSIDGLFLTHLENSWTRHTFTK